MREVSVSTFFKERLMVFKGKTFVGGRILKENSPDLGSIVIDADSANDVCFEIEAGYLRSGNIHLHEGSYWVLLGSLRPTSDSNVYRLVGVSSLVRGRVLDLPLSRFDRTLGVDIRVPKVGYVY